MPTITGIVAQTSTGPTQAAGADVLHYYATTTQTLSSLTQAATGETTFFTLVDVVGVSESYAQNVDYEHTEVALAAETLYAIENQQVTSTVEVGEEYSFTFSNTITDVSVTAGGYFDSVSTLTLFAPRGMRAGSTITFFFSDLVSTTVSISELYSPILNYTLTSTTTITNSIITTAVLNQLLITAAEVTGEPLYSLAADLTGVVSFSGSLEEYNSVFELLTSAANAGDLYETVLATYELFTASLSISDSMDFGGSVYNNLSHDTVAVSGFPWAKDFGSKAWVMNTQTGGLTTYDNFQFTSLAEYKGVIYATSASGVYALTGDTDEGRVIEAEVKTGFLDFGVEQTKRISDIFVGYTGGQLEFDVETFDLPGEVYTYPMEEREAGAPRNNRVKPGRGLSSRYWRFSIRNVDGAAFQLYDVTPDIAASKRRL
jgi:hypothetical protein